MPPTAEGYADYLYWLQFNNNAQCGLFIKVALSGTANENSTIGKVSCRRTDGLFKQMNDHLAGNTHLAGNDFTLADLMSGFALTSLTKLGGRPLDDLPNIQRYVERITQRPAWKKAMAIAGPEAKRPA